MWQPLLNKNKSGLLGVVRVFLRAPVLFSSYLGTNIYYHYLLSIYMR